MALSSDAFDAALRRFTADLSARPLADALAEGTRQAQAVLGAQHVAVCPFDPGAPFACDDHDARRFAALWERVQASGAPEADGVRVAVPVEGLFGPWGVLAADGRSAELGEAQALVRMLRLAAVIGRFVAHHQAADVLAEQEARAQAILETTVDGIITIGTDGRIRAFNQAAERLFGMTAAEALGQNVSVLMPEPDRSHHHRYIQQYLETGVARIIGIGREVTGRRASGEVFPMDLSVSEVQVAGQERLFTGIVRDLSDRRALEQEVLRVSDEERRRIGQDLHDGLGQMLSGIALITSGLARKLRSQTASTADEVEEIAGLVREADTYARTLAHSLVPVELAQGGLHGALERLADSAQRLFGLEVKVDLNPDLPDLDPDVALHVYRIAQEAVSNAVRHGGAQRVLVGLASSPDDLRLVVTDDGRGFEADGADRPNRGIGLRIMHHRARLIGATLDVKSRPGEGTTITAIRRHAGETSGPSEPLRALPRR